MHFHQHCAAIVRGRPLVPMLVLMSLIALTIPCAKGDQIAFFYALDVDFVKLKLAGRAGGQALPSGDRSIQRIHLGAHTVFAIKMGSGVVESAVSAETLLARFRCDLALSVGPVGGLVNDLAVGDWIRVKRVVNYQNGSWTTEGFARSEGSVSVLTGEVAGDGTNVPVLLSKAREATVASGEIFVASDSYRNELRAGTEAEGVEMNLSGLLAACRNHRVPLVCWRIVSDRADDSANNDFKTFVSRYDGAGGKAVAELIQSLPPNANSPATYPELRNLIESK